MLEEYLLNYGVAGAMLIYFMYSQMTFQKEIKKVVENNTIALTRVYETLRGCSKNKK